MNDYRSIVFHYLPIFLSPKATVFLYFIKLDIFYSSNIFHF